MEKNKLGKQEVNSMMAIPSHDDFSRELFIQEFLWKLNTEFVNKFENLFPNNEPSKLKIKLEDVAKQRKVFLDNPSGKIWSSLRRIGREWTCEAVGPTVEKQLPNLINKSKSLINKKNKLGSLKLDKNMNIPNYVDIDIHLKPGGYFAELCENDIFAGAEYERTTYLNVNGLFGPKMESLGEVVSNWVKKKHTSLKPKKILEIGCAIGQSTLAWAKAFPNAKIHGIDLSAPMLRYAHSRAETLNIEAHYSQQNAEKTNFKDNFFDIVVSHATLHETSLKALQNIFRECYRILNHNGLMIHNEGKPFRDLKPVDRIIPDWDTHFNAEPFISKMRSLDLTEIAQKNGWQTSSIYNDYADYGVNKKFKEDNNNLNVHYILVGKK